MTMAEAAAAAVAIIAIKIEWSEAGTRKEGKSFCRLLDSKLNGKNSKRALTMKREKSKNFSKN
jgi:hypothetical protein